MVKVHHCIHLIKKINPYKTVKEYIVHDKIASFEVREYEGNNK